MIPVFNTCTTLSARNFHVWISSGKHVLFLCDSLQAFPHMADKTTYLIAFIIFALFCEHAWWFFLDKDFLSCTIRKLHSTFLHSLLVDCFSLRSGGSVWVCFRRKFVTLGYLFSKMLCVWIQMLGMDLTGVANFEGVNEGLVAEDIC